MVKRAPRVKREIVCPYAELVEGGREQKRIANEIRFLTKEFDGDLTYIKRLSNCKGGRLIISAYAGNTLVATALLKKRKLNRWEFAFMVVHNKARSCGLGSKMARLAMRMTFDTGAKAIYVMGNREYDTCGVKFLPENSNPVAQYWKRLGFRRTTFADFEDTVEDEDLDIVPLKMGSRSKHVKALPAVADCIANIIKVTKSIGKRRKLTKKNDASIRIISPWLGEYKTDGKHSWINEVRFDPMSKVLAEAPAQMQARMDSGISAPAYMTT
jgi:hypothetical protein